MRAYLDIETTFDGAISVIGVYRADRGTIQLVGGGINDLALYGALEGIATLVTFNGSGFDLPVIRKRMYVDLHREFAHDDLMYICRKRGLRGGLKRIEEALGIIRGSAGILSADAPRLWYRYQHQGDEQALTLLLNYNRDDVVNLARLEYQLGITPETSIQPDVLQVFV